jgi:hypothetical protein
MGDYYFNSKHISMPIADITKSTISIRLDIREKMIRRLNWYAFERYEETKFMKFKKTIGHSFPMLYWLINNMILKRRLRRIKTSTCTTRTKAWFRMKI